MDILTRLLGDLCAGTDPAQADDIARSGRLEMDGVPVELHAGGEPDPAALIAWFDLGALPGGADGRATLVRLMELNTVMVRRGAPHFGLDPETGGAMLMLRIETDGLTADGLRRVLAEQAALARTWQRTRFADGVLLGAGDAAA